MLTRSSLAFLVTLSAITPVLGQDEPSAFARFPIPEVNLIIVPDRDPTNPSPTIAMSEGKWREGYPIYQLIDVEGHNGEDVSLTVGPLPEWLTFLESPWALSATSAEDGTLSLLARADDGVSTPTEQVLDVTIHPAVNANDVSNFTVQEDTAFTRSLSATGIVDGPAQWSWSPDSATRPATLSISGSTLSGTINTAGVYSGLILQAQDPFDGASDQTSPFTITVNARTYTASQAQQNYIAALPTFKQNASNINTIGPSALSYIHSQGWMPGGATPNTGNWATANSAHMPWTGASFSFTRESTGTIRHNFYKVTKQICVAMTTQPGLEQAWTYNTSANTINEDRSLTASEASNYCRDNISVGIRYYT